MFEIIAHCKESFNGEIHIVLECFWFFWATHNLDHFNGEFEISRFEFHISCGRNIKDEPEIDMDQVAFVVDQNIAIMSIFNLKNVGYDGIGGLASNKVLACHLEIRRVFLSELINEVRIQTAFIRFAEHITWNRVLHAFDNATDVQTRPRSIRNRLVRERDQFQIRFLENTLEQRDNLQCELILPHVIEHFENATHWLENLMRLT